MAYIYLSRSQPKYKVMHTPYKPVAHWQRFWRAFGLGKFKAVWVRLATERDFDFRVLATSKDLNERKLFRFFIRLFVLSISNQRLEGDFSLCATLDLGSIDLH